MDRRICWAKLLVFSFCLGVVGAEDSAPCPDSCDSCDSCAGGTGFCECEGECAIGSPTCQDGPPPMCVCADDPGPDDDDDDDDGDLVYLTFAIPLLIICWIRRCLTSCTSSSSSNSSTTASIQAHEAEQREQQLRQHLAREQSQSQERLLRAYAQESAQSRERTERLVAEAVATALRTAHNGQAQPDAPVVQAVPVGAAVKSTGGVARSGSLRVVGVDQSVESPAVPSRGRRSTKCHRCGKQVSELSGLFCPNCGTKFGSE